MCVLMKHESLGRSQLRYLAYICGQERLALIFPAGLIFPLCFCYHLDNCVLRCLEAHLSKTTRAKKTEIYSVIFRCVYCPVLIRTK